MVLSRCGRQWDGRNKKTQTKPIVAKMTRFNYAGTHNMYDFIKIIIMFGHAGHKHQLSKPSYIIYNIYITVGIWPFLGYPHAGSLCTDGD